jgi:hypothetical protein
VQENVVLCLKEEVFWDHPLPGNWAKLVMCKQIFKERAIYELSIYGPAIRPRDLWDGLYFLVFCRNR